MSKCSRCWFFDMDLKTNRLDLCEDCAALYDKYATPHIKIVKKCERTLSNCQDLELYAQYLTMLCHSLNRLQKFEKNRYNMLQALNRPLTAREYLQQTAIQLSNVTKVICEIQAHILSLLQINPQSTKEMIVELEQLMNQEPSSLAFDLTLTIKSIVKRLEFENLISKEKYKGIYRYILR